MVFFIPSTCAVHLEYRTVKKMKSLKILFTKKIPTKKLSLLDTSLFEAYSANFISIKKSVVELEDWEASLPYLIFTSKNAVKFTANFFTPGARQEIYAVGRQTANFIKKNWNKDAKYPYSENAKGLIELIREDNIDNLIYFCGKRRRKVIEEYLETNSKQYICKEVYDTELTPPVDLDDEYNLLCFFSPSAVDSYLLRYEIKPNQQIIAIGKVTAQYLQKHTTKIMIPPEASVDSMINYLNINFRKE